VVAFGKFGNFCRDKREIWHGGADLPGQRVAPAGRTIFRPLSKNNTGMAALRAGLPVTTICHTHKTHV